MADNQSRGPSPSAAWLTAARSAGILLYRTSHGSLEVLLVHPGRPLWRNKDLGAWQMPKGMVEAGEEEDTAARR